MSPLRVGLLTLGVAVAFMVALFSFLAGIKALIDRHAPGFVVVGLCIAFVGATLGVFAYCIARYAH